MIARSRCKAMLSLAWQKVAKVIPRCLQHFAFPLAMNENSSCSISSPAFGMVYWILTNLKDVQQYLILILNFLVTYEVGCIFIHLFCIHIPSVLMFLFMPSVHYFLIRLIIFLSLNFKSSLCIWKTFLCQLCLFQIDSPSLWLVFSFS